VCPGKEGTIRDPIGVRLPSSPGDLKVGPFHPPGFPNVIPTINPSAAGFAFPPPPPWGVLMTFFRPYVWGGLSSVFSPPRPVPLSIFFKCCFLYLILKITILIPSFFSFPRGIRSVYRLEKNTLYPIPFFFLGCVNLPRPFPCFFCTFTSPIPFFPSYPLFIIALYPSPPLSFSPQCVFRPLHAGIPPSLGAS